MLLENWYCNTKCQHKYNVLKKPPSSSTEAFKVEDTFCVLCIEINPKQHGLPSCTVMTSFTKPREAGPSDFTLKNKKIATE